MPDYADNPLKDPDVYPHGRVGSSPVPVAAVLARMH